MGFLKCNRLSSKGIRNILVPKEKPSYHLGTPVFIPVIFFPYFKKIPPPFKHSLSLICHEVCTVSLQCFSSPVFLSGLRMGL